MEAKTLNEVIQSYRDFNISQLKRGIANILTRSEKMRPGFSLSWLMAALPGGFEILETYNVKGAEISLVQLPGETESLAAPTAPAPFKRIDYVAVVLGLLAFIAVGGLIPLWLWACLLYPSCRILSP